MDLMEQEILDNVNGTMTVFAAQDDFIVPSHLLIVLSIAYGTISLLAILGNLLVIWVVLTCKQMHTVTNFFIGNLAFSDVIIGCFSIPFQFQAAVLQRWDLPTFMCPFCPFIQVLSVNVSIFTLTAIAIDRHKAIVNPLRAKLTKNGYKIVIVIIWTIALSLALPMIYGLRVIEVYEMRQIGDAFNETEYSNSTKPFCANVNMSESEQLIYRYTLVIVQYIIPVIVISFVYIQMAVKLWGSKAPGTRISERDTALLKNKKKVIKMLVIVVVSFCLAWMPLQTYFILAVTWPAVNEYKHIQIIFLCCDWLAMSNSTYNPFIYGIYNEKFQREFYKRFSFLQKFGFGKRFKQSVNGLTTGATMISEEHHHHLHHNERNWSSVASTRLYGKSSMDHNKKYSTSVNYPSSIVDHSREDFTDKSWHSQQPEMNPFIAANGDRLDEDFYEEREEDFEMMDKKSDV